MVIASAPPPERMASKMPVTEKQGREQVGSKSGIGSSELGKTKLTGGEKMARVVSSFRHRRSLADPVSVRSSVKSRPVPNEKEKVKM